MDPGIDLLVLVLYPALQMPAVAYLARHFELDGGVLPGPPTGGYWLDSDGSDGAAATTGTNGGDVVGPSRAVVCGRCGERNERGYVYCRACVSRLR